ncbi:hypothetical protein ACRALDRAFT_1062802 [Sodiomyces alcalophilus JCM 7366]|uniref:uncharacterized protein n=1 Tax=Sodiomyces alcalophilus JCM 7366 TaxID=591952 RepID=UPI0039B3BB5B
MSSYFATRRSISLTANPSSLFYAPATKLPDTPLQRRGHSTSYRQCLSGIWIPKGVTSTSPNEDAHGKLVRAGFLRQSHPGIFHMLPLGRRVQDKLERLLDDHLRALGASRISLSSITSKQLWQQSGRFPHVSSEIFDFRDRKGSEYLLSPTHEEEVTALVAQCVNSYKELPLRLYQITRKYRDEIRPRRGLLRAREFIMKDLYTFDTTSNSAANTYVEVQHAYAMFFRSLGLPFVRVEANSGEMGGNLSHEYHLPISIGDDLVVTCCQCDYAANAEMLRNQVAVPLDQKSAQRDVDWQVWRGISKDRLTLINAWFPIRSSLAINSSGLSGAIPRVVQEVVPDLDSSVDHPLALWLKTIQRWSQRPIQHRDIATIPQVLNLIDYRLGADPGFRLREVSNVWGTSHVQQSVILQAKNGTPLDLVGDANADRCPRCGDGVLKVMKALEIGHTFHLGTRYSDRLGATVSLPGYGNPSTREMAAPIPALVPIQMGCYGIGVSRLIGAIAQYFSDDHGLQWPRVIAPFEVAVLCAPALTAEGVNVYDMITNSSRPRPIDVVLDDRPVSLPWKMKDADLVGYPILIILGKHWKAQGDIEVQCRRLGIRRLVRPESLQELVHNLLENLG